MGKQNNMCTQCQRNAVTQQYEQYQHAEHVGIGGDFSLVMGTGCVFFVPVPCVCFAHAANVYGNCDCVECDVLIRSLYYKGIAMP